MDLDFRPVVIFWACLSLVLIGLELFLPGVALVWLGLAAGAMMLLVYVSPDLSVFWQAVLFIASSFGIVWFYWSRIRKTGIASTQPLLNRRGEQLVGQVHPLETAIENGRGRLKIGDAFWQVIGPDLPQGERVRIVAAESMQLRVERA
jgi:hypothetical protein